MYVCVRVCACVCVCMCGSGLSCSILASLAFVDDFGSTAPRRVSYRTPWHFCFLDTSLHEASGKPPLERCRMECRKAAQGTDAAFFHIMQPASAWLHGVGTSLGSFPSRTPAKSSGSAIALCCNCLWGAPGMILGPVLVMGFLQPDQAVPPRLQQYPDDLGLMVHLARCQIQRRSGDSGLVVRAVVAPGPI